MPLEPGSENCPEVGFEEISPKPVSGDLRAFLGSLPLPYSFI